MQGLSRRGARVSRVSLATSARRVFHNAGGPWWRRGVFEALGSRRYSRPALHGMDRRLDELLDRDRGVFLEAGAHDGFTQSNTYYLERFRDWSGVLVEAVPELHAKAAVRRPRSSVVQCALVAPEQAGTPVKVAFGDLMSKVGGDGSYVEGALRSARRRGYEVEVPARTLTDVLDEARIGALDLMVLDLEGHEYDALRAMDFDSHPVEYLLVEMLDLPRQRAAFDELLAPRFEFVETLSKDDALYSWRR
jgi:FkbM family methyltransferase